MRVEIAVDTGTSQPPARLRVGGGASEGDEILGGPWWDRVGDLRRDSSGHSTGTGPRRPQRAGGSLQAGQRGLTRHRKAMALTQAVRPPEPWRTAVPKPPGLGCFVARPAWPAADVPGEGSLPETERRCGKPACEAGASPCLSQCAGAPTGMVNLSEKQNHFGLGVWRLTVMQPSGLFLGKKSLDFLTRCIRLVWRLRPNARLGGLGRRRRLSRGAGGWRRRVSVGRGGSFLARPPRPRLPTAHLLPSCCGPSSACHHLLLQLPFLTRTPIRVRPGPTLMPSLTELQT